MKENGMTPEIGLAEDFNRVLTRRLEAVQVEMAELRLRKQELDERLRATEEEAGHIASLLRLPQGRTPAIGDGPGLKPADLVVQLLRETGPLHFREIERELRVRGWYQAGGSDPANTLLSKFFRDDRLIRPSRGLYAIRPEGSRAKNVGSRRKLSKGKTRSRRTREAK